jgi:hypothetical protein
MNIPWIVWRLLYKGSWISDLHRPYRPFRITKGY